MYYHSIKPEKVTDVSNLIDHYQERIDGGLTRMQADMENKYKKNPISNTIVQTDSYGMW